MIKIYRRLFNPPEGDKNLRQLVATFPLHYKIEAKFILTTLQNKATDFTAPATHFSKYRYTLTEDAPPNLPPAQTEVGHEIQIDTSTAQPTGRPISFTLSWQIKHGQCDILAFTERYGAVRATVEDSPSGRQLFVRRLTSVWPNAKIKK